MASKDKDQNKDKPDQPSEDGDKPLLEPISPTKRKRLQKAFEHGSMLSSKGEFDYAHDMFGQCVSGDPGNLIYTKDLLANLIKKYNNNKKGGKLGGISGASAKAGMKKASMKKNWLGVIKSGLDYLKKKPWDMNTLVEMAKACEELELDECRVAYLRMALDANSKDVALNRLAAEAFESTAQFDEAIRCLERISEMNPKDLEVGRQIAQMTVQKTIHTGGYEGAESTLDVSVEKQARDKLSGGQIELTEEQRLRREIRRSSQEVTNYTALSDYFFKQEDYDMSEEIMREAIDATGSVRTKEELEDIQIHRMKQDVHRAEQLAVQRKSDGAATTWRRLKEELNKRELEVYSSRVDRYPGDLALQYELGVRLKRAKNYQEAIGQFQKSRDDPKKKALSLLATGECFQQIKQYPLALISYKDAVESSGKWDLEVKKLALYRAGSLSKALKKHEEAYELMSELASIQYDYKDVAKLLDELSKFVKDDDTTKNDESEDF